MKLPINTVLTEFKKPIWLIVHSGNDVELQQLFNYATDLAELELINPYYLIISQIDAAMKVVSGVQFNY